jgi:hypothetical protein
LVVGVVLGLLVGCSNADQENIVQAPSSPVIQDSGSVIPSIEVGSIETNDGKNLKISMGGWTENKFGELSFRKGETFKISVVGENDGELEIGILSINTEQVFGYVVNSGEGEVTITIPEDGEYRIYVSNKDEQSATFDMKLSKAIEGPIV